ncbi:MAG: hypothetical protein LUD72_08985 [Bacteroidales bacterium]|nr:hypothetical protein [Bacteroidales bacterium]
MYDLNLFKAACSARGKSSEELARELGLTKDYFNRKVRTAKLEFDEVTRLTEILKLDVKHATQIFAPGLYEAQYGCAYEDDALAYFSATDGVAPKPGLVRSAAAEDGPAAEDVGDFADPAEIYGTDNPCALYKSIRAEIVLGPAGKEFYNLDDFMEMTGQHRESCLKLMRKIKQVSDVTGMNNVVHRVDYVKFLQYQLDRNAHRGPRR